MSEIKTWLVARVGWHTVVWVR